MSAVYRRSLGRTTTLLNTAHSKTTYTLHCLYFLAVCRRIASYAIFPYTIMIAGLLYLLITCSSLLWLYMKLLCNSDYVY